MSSLWRVAHRRGPRSSMSGGAGDGLRAGWPESAIDWREPSSHGRSVRNNRWGSHKASKKMPKEDNGITFEDCDPSTLFREFAAECMELAKTKSSPEKRALYLKMASVWHQMAQRWETKSQPSP